MSALFAATYPDRAIGLVLYGSLAFGIRTGYLDVLAPFSTEPEARRGEIEERTRRLVDCVENHWGEGLSIELFAPSLAGSEKDRQYRAMYERAAASPALARALIQAADLIDVRSILPSIRVPTLVLHRRGDVVPIEHGRLLAANIPGAQLVELEGCDHIPSVGDWPSIADHVEGFLTGTRKVYEPDRLLSTLLFTDIVASTETAARLGDDRWHAVLAEHDRIVDHRLEEFRGRRIKGTGDGVFAAFDGPARAIRCASAIRDDVRSLGLHLRVGVHSGECEVIGEDLAGLAVHIGARIEGAASPDEVLVSGTVKELVVGAGISFADRGTRELKGVPGEWHLFSVVDADTGPILALPPPVQPGRPERAFLKTARHAPWLLRLLSRRSIPKEMRKQTGTGHRRVAAV